MSSRIDVCVCMHVKSLIKYSQCSLCLCGGIVTAYNYYVVYANCRYWSLSSKCLSHSNLMLQMKSKEDYTLYVSLKVARYCRHVKL